MDRASRFEIVLESVETLPEEDQLVLIDLIRKRLAEQRRAEIAANIAETRQEYQAGRVQRGTVEELMAELDL
jgi:hypothetical protein